MKKFSLAAVHMSRLRLTIILLIGLLPRAWAVDFDQEADFKIERQPLAAALIQFSKQAGVQVLTADAKLNGTETLGVTGSHSIKQALDVLLHETGFSYRVTGASTIVVVPVDRGATSSELQPRTGEKANEKPIALEHMEVTGSRLPRGIDDSGAPLTIYGRAQIERLGITTVSDLLKVIPQNQGTASTSPYNTLGANRYPNLRGLGEGTTLVLINGQRPSISAASAANPATPAQFNLDVIPIAAIERVEVLRDGASAIYGSDAIGGVINLILRRDYSGAELSTRYSTTTSADIAEKNYSAVIGKRLGPVSVLLGGEYYDRDPMLGGARPYSANLDKTPLGGTDGSFPGGAGPIPANIRSVDGENLPGLSSPIAAVPGGSPRPLTAADFAATQGQTNPLFDYSYFSTVVQPQTRSSAFGHMDLSISDMWTASADLFYTKSKSRFDTGFPFIDMTFGAGNPYNPFGVDTLVSFYLVDLPAGGFGISDTQDYGVSTSVKAQLAAGWEIRGSASFGESRLDQLEGAASDFIDAANVAAALVSTDPATALNPLFSGQGISDELLSSFTSIYLYGHTKARSQGLTVGATGPAFALPAGTVEVAIGADARHELLDARTDNFYDDAPHIINKDRDINATYVEFGVPLWHDESFATAWGLLDLSLAARYEKYSDFGDTTNPKIGIRWRPTRALTFRGTWGKAFQAPSLSQLYSPPTASQGAIFAAIFDPVLNESYKLSGLVTGGGNEDLQPQKADTFSIGFRYEHALGQGSWNTSADVYRIDFANRIRSLLPNQEIVNLESVFPQFIVRNPETQRITDIRRVPVNLAEVNTTGIDLSLGYALPLLGGTFDAALTGTIVDQYDVQVSPLVAVQDRRSYVGFSNRFKGNVQLQYSRSSWSASAIAFYADPYQSDRQPDHEIRSQTTVDLQFSYLCCSSLADWLENLKLTVGVINLFDREPPFYDTSQGFDLGEGDPLQRRVYAKLSVAL